MRDSRSARDPQADTPLLQPFQHEHPEAVLGQLEDRLHELGMGIMPVKMIFGTEQFRDNRTEKRERSGMLCTWTRS